MCLFNSIYFLFLKHVLKYRFFESKFLAINLESQTPQIAHFASNPAEIFSQKTCLTLSRSPRTLLRPLTGNLHRGKPIWRALDWAWPVLISSLA
jgi:hypothetical protein